MYLLLHITRFEIGRLARTRSFWLLCALLQVFLGWQFFSNALLYTRAGQGGGLTLAVAAQLYYAYCSLLLWLSPFLTMYSFSEMRRGGALELLLAAPVSLRKLVLGKILGLYVCLLAPLALLSLMPICLLFGAVLDGLLWAGMLLGAALHALLLVCVGVFFSASCKQPATAGFLTLTLFMLSTLSGWVPAFSDSSAAWIGIFNYLSISTHYERLASGMLDSADLCFYLFTCALFYLCTLLRLDYLRTLD